MNARVKGDPDRVAALDWGHLASELDGQGSALVEGLLEPDECRFLAALYSQDNRFRSRVVMSRHGFGRGEYKYFSYPSRRRLASFELPSTRGWRRLRTGGTNRSA